MAGKMHLVNSHVIYEWLGSMIEIIAITVAEDIETLGKNKVWLADKPITRQEYCDEIAEKMKRFFGDIVSQGGDEIFDSWMRAMKTMVAENSAPKVRVCAGDAYALMDAVIDELAKDKSLTTYVGFLQVRTNDAMLKAGEQDTRQHARGLHVAQYMGNRVGRNFTLKLRKMADELIKKMQNRGGENKDVIELPGRLPR